MKLKLGVNCGFAINRYIEPEVWGAIVGGLGLHSVQFVADLLNPFLPDDYIDSQIERIKKAAARYDFSVDSIFTSAMTRMNLLTHPEERARRIWLEWYKKLLAIGARLGAKTGGGHFGTMTFDTLNDAEKRKRVTEAGVAGWRELTRYAYGLGYDALIFEPMSVPREFGNTVAETRALLDAVNGSGVAVGGNGRQDAAPTECGEGGSGWGGMRRDGTGDADGMGVLGGSGGGARVPMKVCLDVGHAPHPDERDPYPWLLALGKVSPVIHLQQTLLGKSMHWPFTPEYNSQGYITAERVIECLEASGCEEALLLFELSHREHWDTDWKVVEDHAASVEYWRKYVKE